jgi:hypothetical protein
MNITLKPITIESLPPGTEFVLEMGPEKNRMFRMSGAPDSGNHVPVFVPEGGRIQYVHPGLLPTLPPGTVVRPTTSFRQIKPMGLFCNQDGHVFMKFGPNGTVVSFAERGLVTFGNCDPVVSPLTLAEVNITE